MYFSRLNKIGFSILFSIAAFSFFSCNDIASIATPNIVGGSSVSRELYPPLKITASQGFKRKIRLDWSIVEDVKYYEIYCAESSHSTNFIKIGKTSKNFFEDTVGSGYTYYYKIKAEDSSGRLSDYSSVVKGTSLATPMLTKGESNESSATVYWYMRNARDSATMEENYESDLRYSAICRKDGEETETSVTLSGRETSYTFKGLDSSSTYYFTIAAYLQSAQNDVETSPSVTMETLHSYIPLSPSFTASEGISAEKIELAIKLPQKVKVSTTTKLSPNDKVNEDYPLCFKIYRKPSTTSGDFNDDDYITTVYYNGSTTAPNPNTDEYEYIPDTVITWTDEIGNGLTRGQKYNYMLKSFVDTTYSAKIGSDYTASTGATNGTYSTGWLIDLPKFSINPIRYTENEDGGSNNAGTSYVAASYDFNVVWDDFGSEGLYKFAIKQNRKKFDDDNGNDEDTVGTDTWVKVGGKELFDSISDLENFDVNISNLFTDGDPENTNRGYYTYTLYIVPASLQDTTEIDDTTIIDSVNSKQITLSNDKTTPISEIKSILGGFTEKIEITYTLEVQTEHTYYFERTNKSTNKVEKIEASTVKTNTSTSSETTENGTIRTKTGVFIDENVEPGVTYEYTLYAKETSYYQDSESKTATTLGIPDPKIGSLDYNKIIVTLKSVPEATQYAITIGEENNFGGGELSVFSATASSFGSGNIEYDGTSDTFTITYEDPFGFDDATLAGTSAKLKVYAMSEGGYDDATETFVPERSSEKELNNVRVLGPAEIDAKVGTFAEATENTMKLTWKKIAGAKGYFIRRVRYNDVAMEDYDNNGTDTYYYDAETNKLSVNGFGIEENRATVTLSGETYTLTDKYAEPDADIGTNTDKSNIADYQKAQSKIALGLPYNYTVLPALSKNDFEFKDDFDFNDISKVKYEKLSKTDGVATFGYGLRVDAAKAESATVQNISWQKPFYSANGESLTPLVVKRPFNSSSNAWPKVATKTKNDTSHIIDDVAETYTAVEYAVVYLKATNSTYNVAPSYVTYLKETLEDDPNYDYGTRTREPLNKGYLLTTSCTAKYGGTLNDNGEGYKEDDNYYSEIVEVDPWDYNERALGPSTYEVKVLSLDLSAGWTTVAEFDKDFNLLSSPATDTTVEPLGTGARLKPTTITNNAKNSSTKGSGITNGPLKILRSAKHYYGVTLKRGSTEVNFTNKYQTYAYRQITDEELIKSTMLVIAQAINSSNVSEISQGTSDKVGQFIGLGGKPSKEVAGHSGNFNWSQDSSSRFWWTFNDFIINWDSLPCSEYISVPDSNGSSLPNFIMVVDNSPRSSNTDIRGRKNKANLDFLCYNEYSKFNASKLISMTITSSTIPLDSYKATLKFASSGSNFTSQITRTNYTGTAYSATTKEDLKKWMPANIDNNGFSGKDAKYGWWN